MFEILCRESGEKGALREAGRITWVSLGQWSSGQSCPQGDVWQFLAAFLVVTFWLGGTQASSASRPGVMPNILQYMEQPHTAKNHVVQNVSGVCC